MNKFIRWWKSDKFYNTFKIIWVIYFIEAVITRIMDWTNGDTSNINLSILAALFALISLQYVGMITNRNKEIKELRTEIKELRTEIKHPRDGLDEIAYRVYR